MTQAPLDRYENLIIDELCEYQSQLDRGAVGDSGSAPGAEIPPELQPSLSEFRRCLKLLHETNLRSGFPSQDSHTTGKLAGYAVPERIGRFAIIEKLGAGGFGIVFRGTDPGTRREVAIKIPRPELLGSPELIERFTHEAAAVAQLDHANILPVFESDCDGIVPYIVMPYVRGETLAHWLATQPAVPPRMAAEIVRQLAEGVAHAHARGVLHRDLKPGNVLLAPRDSSPAPAADEPPFVPKLTDFGLAKCADINQQETRTGTLIGTACYMAPEQAEGRSRDITAVTDVYGLGALLYELLTGAPPFGGANELQTIQNILRDDPPNLRTGQRKVPIDLNVICLKCLEKAPGDRYPSARSLADDLQRFLNGEPIRARPVALITRIGKWCRRHPARAAVTVAAALGLLVLVTVSLWYNARLTAQLQIAERERQSARQHELEARRRAYVADMRTAKAAWDQGDVSHTLKLLDRYRPADGEPDVRDFAWWYLWRQYDEESRVLGTHEKRATAVAITSRGDLAASGGDDSVIRLWALPSGMLLGELRGHEPGAVESLSFSPDDARLASSGEDGTVRVWDVATRKEVYVRREHHSWVPQVAYSPTGNMIASGGADKLVRLWDADTGDPVASLSGHTDTVRCLAFHPSEPTLVTGSRDGTIRLWNLTELGPDARLKDRIIRLADSLPQADDAPRTIRTMALAPEGTRLLAGTFSTELLELSLQEPDFGKVVDHHLEASHPRSLLWPRDGSLIVGLGNSHIRVADRDRLGRTRAWLFGQHDVVLSMAAPPDGSCLVAASKGGSVRYWPQLHRSERIIMPRQEPENVFCRLVWTGSHLATDYQRGKLELYRMPEGMLERTFPKPAEDAFSFSPNGGLLLTVGSDGATKCFRVSDGYHLWTLQLPPRTPGLSNACQAIDALERFAVVACGNEAIVISLRDPAIAQRLDHPKSVRHVRFLERYGEPLTAISTCEDGLIRFWDVATGRLRKRDQAHPRATGEVAVSKDQRFIATVGTDRTVHVWDANDLTQIEEIASPSVSPTVEFLAGAAIVITSHPVLTLWSVRDGTELLSFPEFPDRPDRRAVSPDGNQLAIQKGRHIYVLDGRPQE